MVPTVVLLTSFPPREAASRRLPGRPGPGLSPGPSPGRFCGSKASYLRRRRSGCLPSSLFSLFFPALLCSAPGFYASFRSPRPSNLAPPPPTLAQKNGRPKQSAAPGVRSPRGPERSETTRSLRNTLVSKERHADTTRNGSEKPRSVQLFY